MRVVRNILLILYLVFLVLPITRSEIIVEGDVWKVGTSTKILEMSEALSAGTNRETLRNITTFIDDSELNALASGTVSNAKGDAPYNQYLYLLGHGVSVNSGYVVYTEDDNDITADFLYFKRGYEIGRYLLEFTTALESDVDDSTGTSTSTGTYLTDFEDVDLTMFGKTYTIISARRTSTRGNNIKLVLMNGAVKDTLMEGTTKTYALNGTDYEVTLDFVDVDKAKFTINGEATRNLKDGEIGNLSNGIIVGVSKISYQDYAGGVHSATFYLGTEEIELEDNNIRDADSTNNLIVNNNTIDDAYVIIEGRDNNLTFKIDRIHVNMTAEDDFYVPSNGKLSEIIKQKSGKSEVLFTNNWDIEYKGLQEQPIEIIEIDTSGLSKYILRFKNGDGNEVKVPIAESLSGNQLSFGETNKAFINRENLIITKDDYLVLTDSTDKRGKRKTYVLQYKGADKITADSPVLKFKDLGSGETIEQSYTDAIPLATLKLGGADFRVYKASGASISVNDFDIQVDLDADGTLEISGEFIPITTFYGAEINITNETDNRIDFTIKTLDDDRDENAKDNVETLQATDLSGFITASSGIVNLQRTDNLVFRTPDGQTDVAYAYTSYGTFITHKTPSSEPATLKIEYPQKQREALVYITTKGTTFSDTTPPNIIIINPINGSIITKNSTWLNVTTDEDAVCKYNLCRFEEFSGTPGGGGGGCSILRYMSATGGTLHSQLITGLENTINDEIHKEWYSVGINCIDNFENSNSESVEFYVNLAEGIMISINSPTEGIYNERRIQFNITTSEEVDKITYIDYADTRPRNRTLCRNCDEHGNLSKRTQSFRDGKHNLSFRAEKDGNFVEKNVSFFIDSRDPRISKTEPRRGFTNGIFYVEYTEDNCYAICFVIEPTHSFGGGCGSCSSGKNVVEKREMDLSDWEGEIISYNYTLKDIAGNEASKTVKNIKVDTHPPIINKLNYTIDRKRVNFNINITEKNFDRVEFMDNAESSPRWRLLCTSLREDMCKRTFSFGTGLHNLSFNVTDEAGNYASMENITFTII